MTDQRPHADSSPVNRPLSSSRRRVLVGLGAGVAAAFAGCSSFSSSNPSYEEGTVGNATGDGRTAEETTAAEALAQREVDDSLSPLDAISLEDHEFVLEDGYKGSTVQGALANTGDERLKSVEVRVRVYDATASHLGRYAASTGDVDPGTTWGFQVVLLESPSDIAGYEIAAVGRRE